MKINESTTISLTMAVALAVSAFSIGAWGRWVTLSIADAEARLEADETAISNDTENQLISCQMIRQILMNQGVKEPAYCVTVRKAK